ncbi:MAG: thioredoxin-like domain-containing protein [Gammaproteobacteria bacterium]|nr:thioredoxin-like domain-containing protein [Gammaproteobacteria bacterium]
MLRTASSSAVVLFVACACAPVNEYEIRLDASALEDEASRAVAHGYIPDEDDYGELASVELRNGQATLSGTVDHIRIIQIDVLPADSIYPLGRAEFVLEPGLTTVRFLADSNEVEGGKYTQLAFDSWRDDPEYRAADEANRARFDAMAAMSEEEREASRVEWSERTIESKREALKHSLIQSRILREIYTAHEDPVTRFVALSADRGWVAKWDLEEDSKAGRSKGFLEQISFYESLHQELPGNPVVANAAGRIKDSYERYLTASSIAIGTAIRDFGAVSLDGEPFRLTEVLDDNEYVLVEFWSSWCGPCRAEIPHMKEAYEKYRGQGFEIVSVSLDEEHEDWQEASIEEQIPWIDVGDQQGFESESAKLYGVMGIPANYLAKGGSGEIVGTHLRQRKLDEKLAELYGE